MTLPRRRVADGGLVGVRVSDDMTRHERDGRPIYQRGYSRVWSFHPPGLAAAVDNSGAFHIDLLGNPAYTARYFRTFGFYDGLATVEMDRGWTHITPDGAPIYSTRYRWLGNFQDGVCVAERARGRFQHIDVHGRPTYRQTFRYAGDFREGVAVVTLKNGTQTHILRDGSSLHGRVFAELGVFHKGFATARDSKGWFHVDRFGRELYPARYAAVEPYYNGRSRVQTRSGSRLLIDEQGSPIERI